MRANTKDKTKILLFTQYFYPDITAASFRMYELYKYLKKERFKVEVVTTFPHRSNIEHIEASHDIHRIRVHFVSPKNKFRYVYYYLEFVLKAFFVILKNKFFDCDLIFASSPPIFIGIEALIISKIYKKKLFLDIRDLWPDTVADVGKIQKNSLIYKIFKSLERVLYRKADKIFCVSEPMKKYISAYNSDVTVVYNGISEEDFLRFENKPLIQKDKDIFNVFYAGNIGMAQTLDFVFDAAKKLLNENNLDLSFHIIGEGVKLKEYKEIVEMNNLKNITFYKALPREKLLEYLYNNADILLLPLKEGRSFEKTIPSKLFDYLLLKKPIVYHIYGEGKEILKKLDIAEEFLLDTDNFILALEKIRSNYNKYLRNADLRNFSILKKFLRENQFHKVIQKLQLP